MATITVSLPDDVMEFVETQVDGVEYADSGDYLAELVRRDQERHLEELRAIVEEGLASGVSSRTPADIFAEAVQIAKARGTYRD